MRIPEGGERTHSSRQLTRGAKRRVRAAFLSELPILSMSTWRLDGLGSVN